MVNILQADPSGGWENEKITKALWDELISELGGLCRKAAEVCARIIEIFMNETKKKIVFFLI